MILLLLSTSYSSAAKDELTIKNEVLKAFEDLVAASKALDENAYFSFFDAEKFVGLNSEGTIWRSIDDIRPLIASWFKYTQSVDSLEFPKVKLSVIDNNTVILVNEFEQTMTF